MNSCFLHLSITSVYYICLLHQSVTLEVSKIFMTIRVRVSLFILLLSSFSVSQLKADESVIQTVFEKLASQSHNDVQYTEKKYSSFFEDEMILTGVLRYIPPDTVIREQKTPEALRFEIKGEMVNILRNGESKLVKLDGAPALQVFVDSLRAILAGDLGSLKTYYKIKFSGDVSSWKIVLQPRDNKLGAYIDTIKFAGTLGQIKQIEVHESDEDWSEMKLEPIQNTSIHEKN